MLWVGITGPMGSGKSTVAEILRQMGFEVLDADAVARHVLRPGGSGEAQVFQTFGEKGLRDADGRLDRRALGRVVFGDATKLAALEGIIHPLVRAETLRQRERLAKAGAAAAFYDVPLLFEKNMRDQFDHVLVVSAPKALRVARLKSRSQLTEEEIEERTMHHLPDEVKEAAASAVIVNSGSRAELETQITEVLQRLGLTSRGSTRA